MTPPEITVDRRTLMAVSAAGAAGVALSAATATEAQAANRYFQHGVASGDPRPRGVILWTRLTPTAAAVPGSGVGPRATVTWQVAKDAAFSSVVAQGRFTTGPGRDHTVKLDATGLTPATDYHYRFLYGGLSSPVGRTRTTPPEGADNGNLRFGVVSCSNWQAGWFSAYRHLAKRNDLDAVLHMGDYLYEYGPGQYGYGNSDEDIRPHVPAHEMVSLADYRQRHGQYKTDPDLQRLHAKCAFIATWDDHEVTNDQWAEGAENHQPEEGEYAARRARAHRAYDEWMPIRLGTETALGDGTRLFRRLAFGRLAELSMLDLRSYRSEQVGANGTPIPTPTDEIDDPDRTITGNEQMEWLKRSLRNDRSLWKLVGNPVMITPVRFPPLPADVTRPVNDVVGLLPDEGLAYNVDQWDGYTADRRELFTHIRDHGVQNTVFLTGDIHSAWACDLPVDAGTYPASDSVGTEFVGTSVTSNNLKDITGAGTKGHTAPSMAVETAIQTSNRHVKYLNFDDHGFSVIDITRNRLQMDYFVITDRADKQAQVSRTASWATRVNSQQVHAVAKGIDD